MRAIACLFVFLLFGGSPGWTGESPIAATLFGGFHFGEVPRDDMLCVAGPCTTGRIAVGHRNPEQRVSVYQLPNSTSQLDQVAISTPQYFFFQNRLVRIGFRLDCTPDAAERCMGAVAETFNELYGMTLIRETYDSSSAQEASMIRHYHTAGGQEIEIRRSMFDGKWEQPYVDFNDPAEIGILRYTINPKYRPHDH